MTRSETDKSLSQSSRRRCEGEANVVLIKIGSAVDSMIAEWLLVHFSLVPKSIQLLMFQVWRAAVGSWQLLG